MWAQDRRQTLPHFNIGLTIRTSSRCSKRARNLREHADFVMCVYHSLLNGTSTYILIASALRWA